MRLPNAVKQQIEDAKTIQDALNADPEESAQKKDEDKGAEAKKPEEPAAAPDAGEKPKSDDTDWEKRFKGLQTRYNREVPTLRKELEDAHSATEALKAEIAELKEQLSTPPEPPQEIKIELTEEEREQYGDGWVEIMKKVAGQSTTEMAKQIVDLKQELAELKQGQTEIQKTVVVNTERDFFNALAQKVRSETGRDWREINDDDDFHNFLAEPVPYTGGREKQEFLAEAHKALDVDSAAQFFIDFASSQKNAAPKPSVPEEIVAPEQSKSSSIPPIEEKKVYTTAEIDKFYEDKRKGKYRGKEAEARKIEKDILAASSEGRIKV